MNWKGGMKIFTGIMLMTPASMLMGYLAHDVYNMGPDGVVVLPNTAYFRLALGIITTLAIGAMFVLWMRHEIGGPQRRPEE